MMLFVKLNYKLREYTLLKQRKKEQNFVKLLKKARKCDINNKKQRYLSKNSAV